MRAAILIAFVGIVLGAAAAFVRTPPSLRELSRCFDSQTRAVQESCLKGEIPALLKTYSAKDLLHYAVATSSPAVITEPYNCHLVAHDVGAALYRQTGSLESALSLCTADCQGGCTHGAVIAAIADQIASSDSLADNFVHNATASDIVPIGKRLCLTNALCHGIGHILMETYGAYAPALAACDQISGTDSSTSQQVKMRAENCYEGVFMEGAGAVAQLQLAGSATSTAGYPPFACETLGASYSLACFRFLPELLYSAHKPFSAACGQYSGENRRNCFEGIGYFTGLTSSDVTAPDKESFLCDYSNAADRTACNIGVPSGVNVRLRYGQSLRYCQDLTAPDEKKACFGAAFQSMEYYSGKPASCSKAANAECEAQLKDYEMYKTTLPFYITDSLGAS